MKRTLLTACTGLLGLTLIACAGDPTDDAAEDSAPTDQAGALPPLSPASSAAEIAAYNAQAEAKAGLVYTLEIENKHTLKFFENPAGSFIMETAPMGTDLVLGTEPPSALFAKSHPDAQVPAEIVAFDALMAPDPELPSHTKHATSSFTHFRDSHRACPTILGIPGGGWAVAASPTGCWPNAGGPGATASLATHSHAIAGSYNGNTIATVRNNGVWVTTVGIVQGEIRSFVLSNPSFRVENRRHIRVQEHRYEFDGAPFSRHVGVAYLNFPLAASTVLQAINFVP